MCARSGEAALLLLASSSPRRRALLRRLGLAFSVRSPAADETPLPGERPQAHVRRLALLKARAVARRFPAAIVVGADTVVALDGEILGKPRDRGEAARMLSRLSGRTHEVFTGIALLVPGERRARSAVVRSRVTMKPFDAAAIRRYVACREPLDKAGAYAVQGRGWGLVERVEGSFTNVVGLPIERLRRMLAAAGLAVCAEGRGQRGGTPADAGTRDSATMSGDRGGLRRRCRGRRGGDRSEGER